jgi:DNA mismatch repair protein MutH
MSFNGVAHVRPHGENAKDVCALPVSDQLTGDTVYTKHCFWLNSKYIKSFIKI